ncbi:MAG TPA: FHA domain-containing protein [Blastocatellia bacterium]|jgi:pSer/pThr/pTyr-binding forkhead associated (FHA) protein|nr:FHA domain-containing protein [Blastocatellia bacterium]
MELILNIQSPGAETKVTLNEEGASLGRGEGARVRIDDPGISRLHASVSRVSDLWFIADSGSVNGTFVNGREVTLAGTALKDRDVIKLGDSTTIRVRLRAAAPAGRQAEKRKSGGDERAPRLALATIVVLGALFLAGVGALSKQMIDEFREPSAPESSPTPVAAATPVATPVIPTADSPSPSVMTSYLKMSEDEQYNFLSLKARNITRMMGNREYVFDREALGYIKHYVDGYAKRVGNGSRTLWAEDLHIMLGRAIEHAPDIIASFRRENTPIVLGLYIPVIESEYRKCLQSPANALGLFQFLGPTAEHYGVPANKRCDEKLMAPAAARYMKDRIKEFGTGPMSVALSIAGYNRDPASVRRDLQDVVDSKSNERSFWTLLARKEELDHWFRNENVKYVPKFFAAAIVGENPVYFGLRIRKLSTYDQRDSLQ